MNGSDTIGRTVHYHAKGETPFSDEEWDKVDEIGLRYLQGFEWTCETPEFWRLKYHPNWDLWRKKLGTDYSHSQVWIEINKLLPEANRMGPSYDKAVRHVQKTGLIIVKESEHSGEGFSKIASNEFNAKLLLCMIIEMSLVAPDHKFYYQDEGDYVIPGLIIKDGIAELDILDIEESIRYWEKCGDCINSILQLQLSIDNSQWIARINNDDYKEHPPFEGIIKEVSKQPEERQEQIENCKHPEENVKTVESPMGTSAVCGLCGKILLTLQTKAQKIEDNPITAFCKSEAVTGKSHTEYITWNQFLLEEFPNRASDIIERHRHDIASSIESDIVSLAKEFDDNEL